MFDTISVIFYLVVAVVFTIGIVRLSKKSMDEFREHGKIKEQHKIKEERHKEAV